MTAIHTRKSCLTVSFLFHSKVHLNTVTKDTESNLVQIASRGNYFNNFLTVDISDDVIDIRCNNEIGSEPIKHNFDYTQSGRLVISKSENETSIEGSGQLALLDQSASLLHFSFEAILPLSTRDILGLGLVPRAGTYKPRMESVPVNGMDCTEVIPNVGEFGADYDAQAANVNLVKGVSGRAGQFNKNSRAGVWSMGPHFEGREVSYSVWVRTTATDTPILISYEGYWTKPTVMNLRLRNGRPELVYSSTQRLRAADYHSLRLNDGQWHHIAVTNPADDSFLSDMKMYIDGVEIKTEIDGKNEKVSFPNGGVISLGGFGHGRASQELRNKYLSGDNLVGRLDEVKIFARAISSEEVFLLYAEHSSPSPSSNPSSSSSSPSSVVSASPSLSPGNHTRTLRGRRRTTNKREAI